jgi:hypothetical protein
MSEFETLDNLPPRLNRVKETGGRAAPLPVGWGTVVDRDGGIFGGAFLVPDLAHLTASRQEDQCPSHVQLIATHVWESPENPQENFRYQAEFGIKNIIESNVPVHSSPTEGGVKVTPNDNKGENPLINFGLPPTKVFLGLDDPSILEGDVQVITQSTDPRHTTPMCLL